MHLASQVLVTVFSRPQLGAILGKMEKEAAERWGRRLSEQGQPGRCAPHPSSCFLWPAYTEGCSLSCP